MIEKMPMYVYKQFIPVFINANFGIKVKYVG
jgi:hypothetical protein